MKRKIKFQITVGSHFPRGDDYVPKNMQEVELPVGGEEKIIEIEFETDNANPMKDAEEALKVKMGDKQYHIWYWWWLD